MKMTRNTVTLTKLLSEYIVPSLHFAEKYFQMHKMTVFYGYRVKDKNLIANIR